MKYIKLLISSCAIILFFVTLSASSTLVYGANNVDDIKNMRGIRAVEKDPTKPIFYKRKKKEDKIFLHGIMKKNGKYIAIINGQKRHEGESIDGVKIIKVDKNKVEIKDSSGVKEIFLRSKVGS